MDFVHDRSLPTPLGTGTDLPRTLGPRNGSRAEPQSGASPKTCARCWPKCHWQQHSHSRLQPCMYWAFALGSGAREQQRLPSAALSALCARALLSCGAGQGRAVDIGTGVNRARLHVVGCSRHPPARGPSSPSPSDAPLTIGLAALGRLTQCSRRRAVHTPFAGVDATGARAVRVFANHRRERARHACRARRWCSIAHWSMWRL